MELRSQSQIHVGIHYGINMAQASVSPLAEGVSARIHRGIIAGAQIEIELDDFWSVLISPRFVQKGAGLYYCEALVETGLFNYIDVPVALKVTFRTDRLSPFLTAGITGGYLVTGRFRSEFQYGHSWQYITENMNRFDLSVDAGAGVSFKPWEMLCLDVSLVYSHGLVNIMNTDPKPEYAEWRSRDLKLVTGVSYCL